MYISKYLSASLLSFMLLLQTASARNWVGDPVMKPKDDNYRANCIASTAQKDLDINNVRALLRGGGDMWWNLSEAQYEIPKGSGLNSLFSGALWIGGVDAGGQLKVAAMTYRQSGNDFWPGPLDVATASITSEECTAWDKHFKIDRADVEEYVARYIPAGGNDPNGLSDALEAARKLL